MLGDSSISSLPHGEVEGDVRGSLLDEVEGPEGENSKHLQASRLGRGPPEDVVYHIEGKAKQFEALPKCRCFGKEDEG